MIKWIAAVIGLFYMKIPGAIIGFLIGSFLEFFLKNASVSSGGFGQVFQQEKTKVSPGDFELNLLSLCSIVIKADGEINQRELDYVRRYFVQAYGKERANATFRTFNTVIKDRQVDSARICAYLHMRTTYEVRLQILHFLFGITQADGNVSALELQELTKIARHFRINRYDFESIKAMFVRTASSNEYAYKILEIEKNASNEEVKKAYRKMAKKYHPDKLQHLDEAYQKGAQEKFTKVQEAYEKIQQERGF